MKKTLVALAALAVVGVASAQSTVTLYGKIDAGVRNNTREVNGVKSAAGNAGLEQNTAGLSGSRWGLKGTEDLGGGMRAFFQLEQGFNVDTGNLANAARQFHRQAYVGLGGSWGAVSFGRQYGMIDNLMGYYDAQGYSTPSAMGYAYNGGDGCALGVATDGGSNVVNTCAGRINNAIMYESPNMSGLKAWVMFAPSEDKNPVTGQGAGNYWGTFINYGAGPLGVGFAYEATKATAAAGASISTKMWGVNGSYDLGVAKLYGGYERGTVSNSSAKDSGWSLGAAIPLGAMSLALGYAKETQTTAAGVKSKVTGFAGQLVYPLSKRTNVYADFLQGKSTDNTLVTVTKNNVFGVGVRHDF